MIIYVFFTMFLQFWSDVILSITNLFWPEAKLSMTHGFWPDTKLSIAHVFWPNAKFSMTHVFLPLTWRQVVYDPDVLTWCKLKLVHDPGVVDGSYEVGLQRDVVPADGVVDDGKGVVERRLCVSITESSLTKFAFITVYCTMYLYVHCKQCYNECWEISLCWKFIVTFFMTLYNLKSRRPQILGVNVRKPFLRIRWSV